MKINTEVTFKAFYTEVYVVFLAFIFHVDFAAQCQIAVLKFFRAAQHYIQNSFHCPNLYFEKIVFLFKNV
jgi:hypothetical protein